MTQSESSAGAVYPGGEPEGTGEGGPTPLGTPPDTDPGMGNVDEITWPDDPQGGVDRPSPEGFRDPAARGSEEAAKPPPQEDAEALESALRDGAGFLRPADEYAEQRRTQSTEDGPGTSLA
jgi:hypothetical protein